MRFGHWLYWTNLDPSRDAQMVHDALAEARLAEELGYDAVWFAEHHFLGEVGYGDPVVFATAVAMQTKRVLLGLGVLTLAIHHPVRTAIQTALLDNLSRGRLLVGTSVGTKTPTLEYRGFGTTLEAGLEQIDEAEDLLMQAWTTENLRYEGRHWKVAFPGVRPRPWQKPHPPLYRACISTESAVEMGRRGRLILLLSATPEKVREQMNAYTEAMRSAGFDEEAVQRNLDQLWMLREVYVAETTDQALEEFLPPLQRRRELMDELRQPWWDTDKQAFQPRQMGVMGPFFGSPQRVKEQIAELRDLGVRNLMMTHYGGVVSPEQQANSMRLLSEKVMPYFR